jgi:hypothetical protein
MKFRNRCTDFKHVVFISILVSAVSQCGCDGTVGWGTAL